MPVDFGLIDIGDFQALWKTNRHDSLGNVPQGETAALNSQNLLLKASCWPYWFRRNCGD